MFLAVLKVLRFSDQVGVQANVEPFGELGGPLHEARSDRERLECTARARCATSELGPWSWYFFMRRSESARISSSS